MLRIIHKLCTTYFLILIVSAGAFLCAASYSRKREPLCNKRHETLECVDECPPERTCENKNILVRCAVPTKRCELKCVCQNGYFRNGKGECVLRKHCEISRCNKIHEILKCVHECPPEKTCQNKNFVVRCAKPTKPCELKCVCRNGYFRNAVGECALRQHCDRCPGDHEHFACSDVCDNVCSLLWTQNKTSCPYKSYGCTERCYCADGYARNANNNCVQMKYCREAAQCNKNEVFTECKKTCPPETCESIFAPYDCRSAPPCRPGCACRDGYLRYNSTSQCIPSETCPQLTEN